MREFVLLDSGPLGHACRRPGTRRGQTNAAFGSTGSSPGALKWSCRRSRITRCVGSSPESTLLGHSVRLDDLVTLGRTVVSAHYRLRAWRHAALFWADARQRGIPTASPDALDADVILAACAATIGQPGDQILVATQNVGHLARYCDARLWTTIA